MIKEYTVYKATTPIGKSYIGLTNKGIEERRRSHLSSVRNKDKRNWCWYEALDKWEKEIVWEELEKCTCTLDDAHDMEKKWIKANNTKHPSGYNLTDGGKGMAGFIFTDQMKEKMSKSHLGYVMPQTQKDKIGEGLKRTTTHRVHNEGHTVASKKSISDAKNRQYQDHDFKKRYLEGRKKLRKPFKDQNGNVYQTQQEASDMLKLSKGNICNVLCGRYKQTGGYKFTFITQ